MKDLIAELKKLVTFKETITAGDVVLIASDEPRMIVYGLVTRIEPDRGGRKSWWNVTMQVLAVPPREVEWTLREPQFTGREIFTFDGVEHFIAPVRFASAPATPPSGPEPGRRKSHSVRKSGLRRVK